MLSNCWAVTSCLFCYYIKVNLLSVMSPMCCEVMAYSLEIVLTKTFLSHTAYSYIICTKYSATDSGNYDI